MFRSAAFLGARNDDRFKKVSPAKLLGLFTKITKDKNPRIRILSLMILGKAIEANKGIIGMDFLESMVKKDYGSISGYIMALYSSRPYPTKKYESRLLKWFRA